MAQNKIERNIMKTILIVEKVENGFVVSNEKLNVKRIASNKEELANTIAKDLSSSLVLMTDGKVKTIEFELK